MSPPMVMACSDWEGCAGDAAGVSNKRMIYWPEVGTGSPRALLLSNMCSIMLTWPDLAVPTLPRSHQAC